MKYNKELFAIVGNQFGWEYNNNNSLIELRDIVIDQLRPIFDKDDINFINIDYLRRLLLGW